MHELRNKYLEQTQEFARAIVQDYLLSNDETVRAAHGYACDRLDVPHTTYIGEPDEDKPFIAEEDPRYQLYYAHYNEFTMRVLLDALQMLQPHLPK